MFVKQKSWDNRRELKRRTTPLWSRRITQLEDQDGTVKLKLEADGEYAEVLADRRSAEILWERFKTGAPLRDCISVLAVPVPPGLGSRRAAT